MMDQSRLVDLARMIERHLGTISGNLGLIANILAEMTAPAEGQNEPSAANVLKVIGQQVLASAEPVRHMQQPDGTMHYRHPMPGRRWLLVTQHPDGRCVAMVENPDGERIPVDI